MKQDTKLTILNKATKSFAIQGYDEFSIRSLAKEIPITPSVMYHYFKDKDDLLKQLFDHLNSDLGKKRAGLPKVSSAKEMLKQRIEFQIDNSESIVAVLKYYLAYRKNFKKFNNGYTPDKTTLHIDEVLDYGIKTGEFKIENPRDDSKVITHAINGFLLEYYPIIPKGEEKQKLIERIYNFLIRALKGGEKNERL